MNRRVGDIAAAPAIPSARTGIQPRNDLLLNAPNRKLMATYATQLVRSSREGKRTVMRADSSYALNCFRAEQRSSGGINMTVLKSLLDRSSRAVPAILALSLAWIAFSPRLRRSSLSRRERARRRPTTAVPSETNVARAMRIAVYPSRGSQRTSASLASARSSYQVDTMTGTSVLHPAGWRDRRPDRVHEYVLFVSTEPRRSTSHVNGYPFSAACLRDLETNCLHGAESSV